jgi:hypothetical protein
MTGARHRIVAQVAAGEPVAIGTRAQCDCGLVGSIGELTDHVRQYGKLAQGPAIKVGRIRNGHLTRDAERTHFELEDLEGRAFVLVALPAGVAVGEALGQARVAISSVIDAARDEQVDALRREGVI